MQCRLINLCEFRKPFGGPICKRNIQGSIAMQFFKSIKIDRSSHFLHSRNDLQGFFYKILDLIL